MTPPPVPAPPRSGSSADGGIHAAACTAMSGHHGAIGGAVSSGRGYATVGGIMRVSPYARVRYGAIAKYGRSGEDPPSLLPAHGQMGGRPVPRRVPPPRRKASQPPLPPQPPQPPPRPAQELRQRAAANGQHGNWQPQRPGATAGVAKVEAKEVAQEEAKEEAKEEEEEPHPLQPPPGTTTMVVPAAVAEQVGVRCEWADKVQQETGAGLVVNKFHAEDSWPEERLVHLKGPLDARIAALEQLLRGLLLEPAEDECLVKLIIPREKVTPCRGDADRLFDAYGMDAAVTREKVLGYELGVVAASGEVAAVAAGIWELMKTVEEVRSSPAGEGGTEPRGCNNTGEEAEGAGGKAESESTKSEDIGGSGAHWEEEDGGVDFGGADDAYEDMRELPEPIPATRTPAGASQERLPLLPPLEQVASDRSDDAGARWREDEDDGWAGGSARQSSQRRTPLTDASPAPEGLLLAQAMQPAAMEGAGGEVDAAPVSADATPASRRTPSPTGSDGGEERSPSSPRHRAREPPRVTRPPTPPRSRRQVAAAAAAEAAGGRRPTPPPPPPRRTPPVAQTYSSMPAEGRPGDDGGWPRQVVRPPPPPRR